MDSVDEAIDLVRSHGGRVTPTRRVVLEEVFRRPDPVTAEELAERVQARQPEVALSTVYRNLDELQSLGVVVHAHLGHGATTYQLASRASAYLLCEECGSTTAVPDEMFRELAESTLASFGFVIDPRHFAILGRCRACASR